MMWTMGYNDGVDSVNNNQDPLCTGHKLRQLLPRPITTHAHFQALNHYHLAMAEQNRRDLVSTRQVVASSRWNPTPDQLHALEEIYRRGTRSPSTDQIQQIAAQLRRYGQIEGKNVFYWFQNHKSRERQKRRRQFELTPSGEKQPHYHINGDENGENRDSSAVANKTPHEVEQAKNRTTESGTTAHQKTLSRQAGTAKAECKAAADHGWVGYFDTINDAELLQQRKNATWHTMQFSCNSSDPTNLLNSCSSAMTVSTISTTIPSTFVISSSSTTEIMTTIKPQESINNIIFLEPHNISSQRIDDEHHYEAQTLQLFPVRSTNEKCVDEEEEDERDHSAMNSGTSCSSTSNCQFIEFLPIKNC